jgi:hypothetical protein
MSKDIKNNYDLNSTDWLFAHQVRDGVDELVRSNDKNLAVIPIWRDEDHGVTLEKNISQQIQNGVDGEGNPLYVDSHKSRLSDKEYPLRILVPYNLAGNHFELAVIDLEARNVVKKVNIYNHFNSDYEDLKKIISSELELELPKNPSKSFQWDNENYIGCIDGRCGDAVIAIARLKANKKTAKYQELSSPPYNIEVDNSSTAQIFDALRERHFEEGFINKIDLEQGSDSDLDSVVDELGDLILQDRDIRAALLDARQKGIKEFVPQIDRHVSGGVKSRVIEVDVGYVTKTTTALKNSGYDENFKTELYEKGEWARLDRDFNLTNEPVSFIKAFQSSRLPTNSYIHYAKVAGRTETTAHVGGLVQPPARNNRTPQLVRSESRDHVANITGSGNKGARTTGSLGASGFHGRRQNVINRVVDESQREPALKQSSPNTANIEVLKFVINDTVGYRDNTDDKKDRFKGVTTDGINLEDDVSREYALKHYQSVRDTLKLSVLKHSNRLNDSDSEPEDEQKSAKTLSPKIDLLNRKLRRTELPEKYHGKIAVEKRSLSPLRYDSPYSRSNIDISLDLLEKAKSFEDITKVYAAPIPTIRPTENLISAEEQKKFNTEPRAKKPQLAKDARAKTTSVISSKSTSTMQKDAVVKKLDSVFQEAEKTPFDRWIINISKNPPQDLSLSEYAPLVESVKKFGHKISDENKKMVAKALIRIVETEKSSSPIRKEAANLFDSLIKKDLIDFNYCDQSGYPLVLWISVSSTRSFFDKIYPKCSDEALNKTNSGSHTTLMHTIKNGWFEESEFLIGKLSQESIKLKYKGEKSLAEFISGSDKLTSEQKEVLSNKLAEKQSQLDDIAKRTQSDQRFDMQKVASSLNDISATEDLKPSSKVSAVFHSEVRSRSSSSSNSISD